MEAAAEAGQRLEIALLGGLRVTCNGVPVTFRLRKSAALLAYLATERRPVRRTVLADLLWTEMPESRALANLRTVLHDLRQALPDYVLVTSDDVTIDPTSVDRATFEAAFRDATGCPAPDAGVPDPAASAAVALRLYTGPFLEGFEVDGAPEFDEFVALERQRLQRDAEMLAELVAAGGLARRRGQQLGVAEPATALIGREAELAAVESLLAGGGRLISVVGPGGVGKTRLAHEVMWRASRSDWSAIVDLSGLQDAADIGAAIAQELDLPLAGLRPPLDEVVAGIGQSAGLLLLDNLEQLLPEAADVVVSLVKHCPSLRILATSRSRLRVQAEQVAAVRPFPVPDATADPAVLGASAAVRLFVARARAAGSTEVEDLPSITRVCAAFDGLPLAIELLAARTRLLPPAEIMADLHSVLDPVGGEYRDLPPRQRTLRDSLDWSYRLLTDQGQAALRALGAFQGGAPLGALVTVAAIGDQEGIGAALELVDAGLAERASTPAGPRLTVMESTRAFAAGLLAGSDEGDGCRSRHAQAYLEFARIGERALHGPSQREWANRFGVEVDNLRVALGYAVEVGDAELALELASCMSQYWYRRGHLPEGQDWLERCLALPDPTADADRRLTRLRGQARLDLVLFALLRQPADQLTPIVAQAEADAIRAGDDLGRARAQYFRAMLFNSRDPSATREQIDEMVAGLDRALAAFEAAGERWDAGRVRWLCSHYALTDGDLARAAELARSAEQEFVDLGDQVNAAMCRSWLGVVVGLTEGYAAAEPLLASAFGVQRAHGDVIHGSHTLTAFACMQAGLGRAEEAARMFGACAAIGDRFGVRLVPAYEPLADAHRQLAEDALPADRWRAAFDRGYDAGFEVALTW